MQREATDLASQPPAPIGATTVPTREGMASMGKTTAPVNDTAALLLPLRTPAEHGSTRTLLDDTRQIARASVRRAISRLLTA